LLRCAGRPIHPSTRGVRRRPVIRGRMTSGVARSDIENAKIGPPHSPPMRRKRGNSDHPIGIWSSRDADERSGTGGPIGRMARWEWEEWGTLGYPDYWTAWRYFLLRRYLNPMTPRGGRSIGQEGRGELAEGLVLDLANALSGQAERLADLLEGLGR